MNESESISANEFSVSVCWDCDNEVFVARCDEIPAVTCTHTDCGLAVKVVYWGIGEHLYARKHAGLPLPVPGRQTGVGLIRAERRRQILEEGWDAAHDDKHDLGELAHAAACYAVDDSELWAGPYGVGVKACRRLWPWDHEWDKRKKHSRKRCLEIAGALVAAELDRLIREEMAPK